jgi:hypothetical protein
LSALAVNKNRLSCEFAEEVIFAMVDAILGVA